MNLCAMQIIPRWSSSSNWLFDIKDTPTQIKWVNESLANIVGDVYSLFWVLPGYFGIT